MKVLTFSRYFPKGHPKVGQPTYFVEKILRGVHELRDVIKPIMDFEVWANCTPKPHTIRAGSRFKPGETISLRVWSDKPYHSKQIEFAQVEVKNVWNIEISEFWFINGVILEHDKVKELAANDGLAYDDFISWFKIHPKKEDDVFKGQIISWSNEINY